MTDARFVSAATRQLQDEEERSIAAATRATFWFVAIVLLLLWAGVSDAQPVLDAPVTTALAARVG